MIIDRILLYSLPSRIFTGPKDMKRQLRNFIHQQTPLILPMHNRALPHQNTNHRRMKRNGLESQSLLMRCSEFIDCLPFFHPSAPFLFPPLNFCKTAVITGNLQGASQLDTCPLLTECEHVGAQRYVCVCESMCEGVVCLLCLHAIVSRKVHFGRTGIHLCIGISV